MEFLVDRAELRLIFYVSNSQTYVLHQDGKLTYPDNWCGSGKRFLRISEIVTTDSGRS
jgi:hypothetical protein